jgi:plasmid stabilization system protein ParE
MTWKLRKSDTAIADLADIWTYILAEDPPDQDPRFTPTPPPNARVLVDP